MRNEQHGPDHAAQALAEVVADVTYKDGWTVRRHSVQGNRGMRGLQLSARALQEGVMTTQDKKPTDASHSDKHTADYEITFPVGDVKETEQAVIVEMPCCGFAFENIHTDENDDTYTCPVCANARLLNEVAALRAELTEVKAERERMVVVNKALHDEGVAHHDRAMKAEAEVERMRPVVGNALEWRDNWPARSAMQWDNGCEADLCAAVEAYRATSEQETTDA